MGMDTTSTVTVRKYTTSGMRQLESKHMDHNPEKNHSNKSIQSDLTHLNEHAVLNGTLDETLDKTYSDYINDYNTNLKLQKAAGKLSDYNYKRRLKTVDSETGGDKTPAVDIIATLGNVDTTIKLLDSLKIPYTMRHYIDENNNQVSEPRVLPDGEQQWANLHNMVLEEYAYWIDENTAFNVAQMWTHLDEWSPHAHIEAVTNGHTKSGKLSSNLNNAISESLEMNGITPSNDTRDNFRKFRKLTDSALVDHYNTVLKQYGVDLTMIRTGRHGGQSMEEYKAGRAKAKQLKELQAKLDNQKKQQNARQQLLEEREKKLSDEKKRWEKEKKQIESDNTTMQTENKKYIDAINHATGASTTTIEEALTEFTKVYKTLMSRYNKTKSNNADLIKQNDQLEQQIHQRLQNVVNRENQVTQRENAVQNRENNVDNWAVAIVELVFKKLKSKIEEWLDNQKNTIRRQAVDDYKNHRQLNLTKQHQQTKQETQQLLNTVSPNDIKAGAFQAATNKRVAAQMDHRTPPEGTETIYKDSSPTNRNSSIGRAAASGGRTNDGDDLEL